MYQIEEKSSLREICVTERQYTASEVTTLWRDRNVRIIIIIITQQVNSGVSIKQLSVRYLGDNLGIYNSHIF